MAHGAQLLQRSVRLGKAACAWGDRTDAVAALDQVPSSSAHFTVAGATAIEVLLDGREPGNADEQTLLDAGERTAALRLESAEKRARIRLKVLGAALDWLRAGNKSTATHLLGVPFDEPGIQTGMERAYRDLARETTGMWDRIAMVEKANAIRPRNGYDGAPRIHQHPTRSGPEAHTGWGRTEDTVTERSERTSRVSRESARQHQELELRDARHRSKASREILAALGRSGADPEGVLGTIVEEATRLCGARAAQLFLLDHECGRVPALARRR